MKNHPFLPAFPTYPEGTPGMTLRDYFAGQALAGLVVATAKAINFTEEDAAHEAYKHADAMLAERAKS